jgi:hypothetical protein
MELERKIEKLLRAYAKKRRADAGDAFTLHPATRRILQNEAARLAPKPEDEAETLTLWELFRRRWAVLLGFALIIFFGAALFLPALNKAKMRSVGTLAMKQNKDRELQTVEVENAKPAAPPVAAAELRSEKTDTLGAADGKRREVLAQSELQAANQPVSKTATAADDMGSFDRPVHSFGGGGGGGAPAPETSMTTVSGGTLALGIGGEKNGAASGAVAGLPAAAPVAAPPPAVQADDSAVAQNSFAFKALAQSNAAKFGLNNNNSQRFVQAAAQTRTPAVLDSFEVQQNGNAISVVDRDGSIYNGTLEPVELAVQEEPAKAKEVADKSAVLSDAAKKEAFLAGNAGNVQSPAQNYFFRVAGANRSLKQNVVFTGNLIAISNAATNAATNATQKFSNQNAGARAGQFQSANGNAVPAQGSLFNNSRIAGTATIDDTNKIEINAVPVTP